MRPGPLAPLAQAASIVDLRAGDEVRLRPGLRAALSDDGSLGLLLPHGRVDLEPESAGALRLLLDGDVVVVADENGQGLPPELARRLLREGVIVPAGA